MSAPTTSPPVTVGGVSAGAVLGSEWTKLRTVRSTMWTLVALAVASIGMTTVICLGISSAIANGENVGEVPASFLTVGMTFGQIAGLVLAIMAITSEYATGAIRSSVAAVPRRIPIVVAKAALLVVILFVVGVVVAFVGYFAGNAFFSARGIGVPLDTDGLLRALFGSGVYLAVLGLFGLGLGLLLRHTAAAITIAIAVTFVAGGLVGLIPGTIGDWISKLWPGNAGSTLIQPVPFSGNENQLGPWPGILVFAIEALVLLGVASWLFRRRDA